MTKECDWHGARARKAGIVLSYVYLGVNLIVQLIYVPILLSTIGQEEYGLYQLVGSIMAYLVAVSGVLSSGVGRYYCMYMAKGDLVHMENTLAIAKRIYWCISFIAGIVVLALIPVMRAAYSQSFTEAQLDECAIMMLLLAINLIVSLNNTINNAAITANERFVFLKSVQLATLIIQPVLVVLLLQIKTKAVVVVAVTLLMNIVSALIQRYYAKITLKISSIYHGFDVKLARGMLVFSGAILLVTISDQIFWKSDQLIIGYFWGAAPVAVYSIGSSIFMNFMPVGSTVASVFLPRVSELLHGQNDMGAVSKLFVRVGRLSAILCLFVLGAYIVVGRTFISLWAGAEYDEAYFIALVVMIPMLIDICQNLGITVMQVLDKYYFRGVVYFAAALLNIIMTIVMLRCIGLIGAAISTGVSMLIGNGFVMNWYYATRIHLDIKAFWIEFFRIAIPSMIVTLISWMGYSVLSLYVQGWTLVILGVLMYAALFVGVFWNLVVNPEEKLNFKRLLTSS